MNLIDLAGLALPSPQLVNDLPASGKRLIQCATGYHATVLKGTVTFEHGEATGELPGHLIRGRQPAPAS